MRVLAFVAALLVAGCSTTTDPQVPMDSPLPASDPGPPWVVLSTGCGFCLGSPEVEEMTAIVLTADSHVVRFTYGTGVAGDQAEFEPGAAHLASLAEEVARLDLYGDREGKTVRFHTASAARLSAEDWDRVHAHVEDLLADATDPGDPDFSDCSDCGGAIVEALGADPRRGHLDGDDPQAWEGLLQQMRALEAWIEGPEV